MKRIFQYFVLVQLCIVFLQIIEFFIAPLRPHVIIKSANVQHCIEAAFVKLFCFLTSLILFTMDKSAGVDE